MPRFLTYLTVATSPHSWSSQSSWPPPLSVCLHPFLQTSPQNYHRHCPLLLSSAQPWWWCWQLCCCTWSIETLHDIPSHGATNNENAKINGMHLWNLQQVKAGLNTGCKILQDNTSKIYCSFHISLSKAFWRLLFYYFSFLAETFMMCVNVFYITRNKISAGSNKKWEIFP